MFAGSKSWARSFLGRLGFVKRRASTKAKVTAADLDAHKAQFVFDIQYIHHKLGSHWDPLCSS